MVETQQDCCALSLRSTQIPIRQTEDGVKVQQRATKKLLCEGGVGGGHAHKRDETSCAAKRLLTKRLQGATQFVCYFGGFFFSKLQKIIQTTNQYVQEVGKENIKKVTCFLPVITCCRCTQ